MSDSYQYAFTQGEVAHAAMYDVAGRTQKADKLLSVLRDYFGSLDALVMLDLGASTGIMTSLLAREFRYGVGIDIDKDAIRHAGSEFGGKTKFLVADGLNLAFAEGSFDAVICNQVYEHVPDAPRLMKEIHRVLRPGGVCCFGATNRLKLIETHYGRLPFLSIIPKPMAHLYLRILGKAHYYYETHLTVWGLRRLVADFELIDYTSRIVADPITFHATDMVTPNSLSQRLALFMLRSAYWLFPGYIWLLRKPV